MLNLGTEWDIEQDVKPEPSRYGLPARALERDVPAFTVAQLCNHVWVRSNFGSAPHEIIDVIRNRETVTIKTPYKKDSIRFDSELEAMRAVHAARNLPDPSLTSHFTMLAADTIDALNTEMNGCDESVEITAPVKFSTLRFG